jgi:hypothetical protein
MIENVSGDRLTAGPGEGPEGRRQSHFAELFFRLFPKRRRFVGKVEADFRRMRHVEETRVGADESGFVALATGHDAMI